MISFASTRCPYIKTVAALAVLVPAFSIVGSGNADAASCWNHNGSIMRLEASGNQRWFYYQNPKQVLRRAGVRNGTLYFNGTKNGNSYSGTARRFSRFCPGSPQTYYVEGPVRGDQLQVTLFGQYEVHKRCQNTGSVKNDRLVFTYSHQC